MTMPISSESVSPLRRPAAPRRPCAGRSSASRSRSRTTTATIDWIDAAVAERRRGYVCVAAVHTVMACREDPELRAAVLGADFTVPDGQPLVWALRALGPRAAGPRLRTRADGRACARAAETGQRMYLYGGRNQGALAQLARTLRLRHPGLRIVGGYCPPFRELTDAEEDARSRTRSTGPAPTSSGSGSACRSRRSGWHGCATGSTRRCSSASAPRSTSTPASSRRRPDALQRLGLEWVVPARARAAPAVAALPALQPALRARLRPPVRAAARTAVAPPWRSG